LAFGAVTTAAMMPATPADAAVANATADRMAGMSFLTENQPIAGASADFQRIKADGANTVSFDVWWEVPTPSSSSIAPAPGITDSDADLMTAAQEARGAGLRVTLTPKFVVGTNTWRGLYNPPDPATFFSGYQTMIDHYASLAQQAGISMLYVGSEMIDADGYLGYWHQAIASARQHYSGPLSYEEDWREVGRFNFGDAVDVVAISAYFPLSDDPSPTLAQLEAGWHSYQGVDAFAQVAGQAQRWGKPILFGEAGYQASSYAGRSPWYDTADPTNDPGLQGRAYQALLDTFVGQPWWNGVTWWAWNNGDTRSPEGKPAEGLIGARSVAFHPPATAPGGSGSAASSRPSGPSATGSRSDPTADGVSSTGATATVGGTAPGDGPPPTGLPGSDGLAPQPGGSSGLVGIGTSHGRPGSRGHLAEMIVAALALITGGAASARLIARAGLLRRRS
jgi:hypothetical protein